jgi:hypothetical protein
MGEQKFIYDKDENPDFFENVGHLLQEFCLF